MNGGLGVYNQEFLGSAIHNLIGEKYELARKINRHKIWQEIKANKYKIEHFQKASEQFSRVFHMLFRYYAKIKDAILNLEEAWSFLMEMIYQRIMEGQLLFEQYHKQLFEREVLQNQHIADFINEIKTAFSSYSIRKKSKFQGRTNPRQDSIIENIYQYLVDLEEDINFQNQMDTGS